MLIFITSCSAKTPATASHTIILSLTSSLTPIPLEKSTATVTITLTNTPEPSSTATPTDLLTDEILMKVIKPYSEAMGLDQDQVLTEIRADNESIQTIPDDNGGEVKVVVHHSVPLLIYKRDFKSNEWRWMPFGLRDVGDMAGFLIGTHVDGSEEDELPIYWETVGIDFSIFFAGGTLKEKNLRRWGTGMINDYISKGIEFEMTSMFHPAFWHQDIPPELKTASKIEVEEFMRDRIERILGYSKKFVDQGIQPIINFYNEALWIWDGKYGWEDSPYYRTFGNDVLIETYLMFYEEAAEQGLEIGKDIRLSYSDYYLHTDNIKSKHVYSEIQRLKKEVASRLNIDKEDVQIDSSFHVRLDVENQHPYASTQDGRRPVPTKDELVQQVKLFSELGKVYFTETHIINATPEERLEIFTMLANVMKEEGVDVIIFEQPLI